MARKTKTYINKFGKRLRITFLSEHDYNEFNTNKNIRTEDNLFVNGKLKRGEDTIFLDNDLKIVYTVDSSKFNEMLENLKYIVPICTIVFQLQKIGRRLIYKKVWKVH